MLPGCSAACGAHPLPYRESGTGPGESSAKPVSETRLRWHRPGVNGFSSALCFPRKGSFLVSRTKVSESFGLHIIRDCLLCRLSSSPLFRSLSCPLGSERSEEATFAIKSLVLGVMPLEEEAAVNTIM